VEPALARKAALQRGIFIGRDKEMAALEAGLQDAISGRGRLFLLVGEPGVGKTRLADEIVACAQGSGVLTLWGRCWDGGEAPSYWPWTQIIRSYLAQRDSRDLTRWLGPAARAIAELAPELGEPSPGAPFRRAASPGDSDRVHFQLFDAVARFFWKASQQEPLVIVLDDLHVADAPSFLLLEFLARNLRDSRILIVGTYRDVEANRTPEVSRVLGTLAREGRYLALRCLEEAEVGAFVAEISGDPPKPSVVRALYEATEGLPFFVDEMVRFLVAEGRMRRNGTDLRASNLGLPQGIRDAVRRRIEGLCAETKTALTVAAVIGREFGLALLEQVSGLGADQLLDAMREAERYEVVERSSMAVGQYSFSHVLVRDTIYQDCPLPRRIALHQAIGEALEALPGDRKSRLPGLAHHFFQAGGEKALGYCVEAARQDVKLRAYEGAAEHYHRALEVLAASASPDERVRCELLLGLSEVQRCAGDTAAASSRAERAADLGRLLGEGELLARAALSLATVAGEPHFVRRADAAIVGLLREALEAVGPEDTALRARLLARLAVALRFRANGAAEERASAAVEAVKMAERLGDPATLLAVLYDRQITMLGPDSLDARTVALAEILRLASELGDREMMFRSNYLRLLNCLEICDAHGAEGAIEACATLAEGLRRPSFDWQAGMARFARAQLDGRFDEAAHFAERVLEADERAHCEASADVFLAQRFAEHLLRDRLEELVEPVKRMAEEHPWLAGWRSGLAFLYAWLGRESEARGEFESLAKDAFEDLPRDETWYPSMWFLGMTCAYLRDSKRAVTLYEQLLPCAGRCFSLALGAVPMGSVSSILGLLAATAGAWGDAERHLENGVCHAEMEKRPFELLALVQYAKAQLGRSAGRDAERIRALLDRAAASAGSIGMRALQLEAERLAEAVETESGEQRNVFQKAGDHWTISYEGTVFHLKDSIGLRYIAHLLRHEGQKIPAPEIVLCAEGVQTESISAYESVRAREVAELGLTHGVGDAGDLLDAQAEQAYRQRFAELEAAMQEAKAFNDLGRVEAIIHEQDFLVRELSAGVGVGGRSRRAASFAERARLNVTRAIKAAIERIAAHCPALAEHLRANIDTGKSCLYTPDRNIPICWVF
jgi:tetratricopeptide (TPR) repeat protein